MEKKKEFILQEWDKEVAAKEKNLEREEFFTDKAKEHGIDSSLMEKVIIRDDDHASEREKEIFAKQITDLFELLELEKDNLKKDAIKIYLTDSAPSKPWKFH